ncbi:MAG TPA: hypothetical protein VGH04_02455, partial [Gemmatimonadaceae bacterium]
MRTSHRRCALVKAAAGLAGSAALGLPMLATGQSAVCGPTGGCASWCRSGPKGTSDIIARILAVQLTKRLVPRFVAENKGGSGLPDGRPVDPALRMRAKTHI